MAPFQTGGVTLARWALPRARRRRLSAPSSCWETRTWVSPRSHCTGPRYHVSVPPRLYPAPAGGGLNHTCLSFAYMVHIKAVSKLPQVRLYLLRQNFGQKQKNGLFSAKFVMTAELELLYFLDKSPLKY